MAEPSVLEVQRWLHSELVLLLGMGLVMVFSGPEIGPGLLFPAIGLAFVAFSFRIHLVVMQDAHGDLVILHRNWIRWHVLTATWHDVQVERARIRLNARGVLDLPPNCKQELGVGFSGLLVVAGGHGPTVVRVWRRKRFERLREAATTRIPQERAPTPTLEGDS